MPVVKTAVSLDNTLFQKAEKIATELELSRSGLYALAIEEFLERYETKKHSGADRRGSSRCGRRS